MNRLLAIGEALIDFIPETVNVGIKDVAGFQPTVGGAPANVCGAFVRLGGEAAMITQLGDDPFGDKIVDEFVHYHIGTEFVQRTKDANTSLAFVALKEDGNREFSFYRKPGADMLLSPDKIQKEWFTGEYALHFCSVSLGNFPMKAAHERAIEYARQAGLMISFDPNIRKILWNDETQLKERVLSFLPKADIVKVSDEELEFITGTSQIKEALPKLMVGNVKLVIYTMGSKGAMAFTNQSKAVSYSRKIQAVDTTGAGDGFMGAILFLLHQDCMEVSDLQRLTGEQLEGYLSFANSFCAYSVQESGAIASYPTKEVLADYMESI